MRRLITATRHAISLLPWSRRRARALSRCLATVLAVLLLATVLALVGTVPPAKASTNTWYAYAAATTSGLTSCPETSIASQECTLVEALTLVTPGGSVYLATAGNYVGNWVVTSSGTSSSAPVTIEPAPGVTNPTLDGNIGSPSGCQTASCDSSVLTVGTGVYADIEGITFYVGDATSGNGGAINNSGNLSVAASSFNNDQADLSGGAIYNTGALTVTTSTFLGDSATYDGGAIYNLGGIVSASGSVFEGNSVNEDGGAIYNGDNGSVTLSGSSLDGNSVTDAGGALYTSGGSVSLSGSTFAANVATLGLGGAIYNDDATLTALASTFSVYASPDTGNLIYGGGAATSMAADVFDGSCTQSGVWQDEGYNVASDATCRGGGPDDVDYAQSLANVLGPPSNNGGPNLSPFFATMMLLPGNPALGLIPDSTPPVAVNLDGSDVTPCPTTDQRGDPSTPGLACDAGAVQVPSTTTPTVTTTTTAATNPTPVPPTGGAPVVVPQPPTTTEPPTTPSAAAATTTTTTPATVSATTTTTPATTAKSHHAKPVVTELTTTAALSGDKVRLALGCSAATCLGLIKLWYDHVLVGEAAYRLPAGSKSVFTMVIGPSVAKHLDGAKGHKLRVTQTVTVTGGSTIMETLQLSTALTRA